jgi:hypothetical protein
MSEMSLSLLATNWSFGEVMWSMFIFFAWVVWLFVLFLVIADNFARKDHSGLAKAGWTLFVIFLPVLGVLVYMITRPKEDLVASA